MIPAAPQDITQGNRMRIARLMASIWLAGLALQACGGGGGDTPSDPLNAADGLGDAGHLPGTVTLGLSTADGHSPMFPAHATAVLHNDGRALAVWRLVDNAADQRSSLVWSARDTQGRWSARQPLTQVNGELNYQAHVLQANSQGDAVLGWVPYTVDGPGPSRWGQLLRYRHDSGWEAAPLDVASGVVGVKYTAPGSWSLSLQDDLTVRVNGAEASGLAGLLQFSGQGQTDLLPSTRGQALSSFSPFTTTARSGGLEFFKELGRNPDGLQEVRVRLNFPSDDQVLGSVPVQGFTYLCNDYSTYNTLITAAGASSSGAAAILAADHRDAQYTCMQHELVLARVDTLPGVRVATRSVNTPHTQITSAPRVAMDAQGRALAVWCEGPLDSYGYATATRCMWSQSLPGEGWSEPRDVIDSMSSVGSFDYMTRISLAMNRQGEAVAALQLTGGATKTYNPLIMVGRFSFSGGWQPWFRAANKNGLTAPEVAINDQGQALLVYAGMDAPRVQGKAPSSLSYTNNQGPQFKSFALAF
jgi:hypothetical protein